jgi:hypothetical protein
MPHPKGSKQSGVHENKLLGTMFGCGTQEVTGDRTIPHDEEAHNLHSSLLNVGGMVR